MVPRRSFLRTLAVASAATALGARSGAATSSRAGSGTADLSLATFTRLRGQSFSAGQPGHGAQRLVLNSVEGFNRGPRVENFVIRFDGQAANPLPEGICHFHHPDLGRCEIFVVAKRLDPATVGYEAVFNRLT